MMKALMLTLGVALATGPLLAEAQDLSAMQRCRALNEAAARLSCYDAIKLPAVAGKAAVQAAVAVAPVTSPVSAAAPADVAVAVAVDVAVAAPVAVLAAAEPAPTAAPAAAQFGLESKATTSALDQIESQIMGEFEGWDARTIFRLTNGQVWQVTDDSTAAYALRNPKVTIRRGMFSAFYLEVDGAKRSPRVKRLR